MAILENEDEMSPSHSSFPSKITRKQRTMTKIEMMQQEKYIIEGK